MINTPPEQIFQCTHYTNLDNISTYFYIVYLYARVMTDGSVYSQNTGFISGRNFTRVYQWSSSKSGVKY